MTDCIFWAGAKARNGYGNMKLHGKNISAHKWAYERVFGPVPEGKILRHTCDNKACIEPTHIIPGTYLQNAQDAKDRNRPRGRWKKKR